MLMGFQEHTPYTCFCFIENIYTGLAILDFDMRIELRLIQISFLLQEVP